MSPWNSPIVPSGPAPMGICTGIGWLSRRSAISPKTRSNSAPMRSILLMKQSRGTLYLVACRQTVSLCASTPSTAEKTTTAPSRTRSERSTSAVKSTWPGVSMMLIVIGRPSASFQRQVMAAATIVMPRSRSSAR